MPIYDQLKKYYKALCKRSIESYFTINSNFLSAFSLKMKKVSP